jgi:hypothetical protein
MTLGIKIDLILEEVLRERKHIFLISPAKLRISGDKTKQKPLFFVFFN